MLVKCVFIAVKLYEQGMYISVYNLAAIWRNGKFLHHATVELHQYSAMLHHLGYMLHTFYMLCVYTMQRQVQWH